MVLLGEIFVFVGWWERIAVRGEWKVDEIELFLR